MSNVSDLSDLERFHTWAGTLLDGVEERMVPTALKKAAVDFLERVIKKTPVDTGRARAGWTAFLDEEGVVIDLGETDQQAVEEGKKQSFFRTSGEPIRWIEVRNSVPYIVRLEHGHSDQAPAGMVRVTIREMEAGGTLEERMMAELENAIIDADKAAGFR